jgi:hypothetical protein
MGKWRDLDGSHSHSVSVEALTCFFGFHWFLSWESICRAFFYAAFQLAKLPHLIRNFLGGAGIA